MIYAINYARNFRYMNEVDEIILNYYSGTDTVIDFIPKLVKDNKQQRIILNILNVKENKISAVIIYLTKLIHDGYNIAAIILDKPEIIKQFKEANIPFFFAKHASNLETVYAMAQQGVSDIYIVEELGFRVKDLQYIRTHFNVKLRVFPNIAQSAKNQVINGMERFWIRPEDTELYEPYIDVFELLSGEDTSRLSVVYEIYRQRQWLGKLNDLILDFQEPIVENTGMNPHFGEMRLNCGKKCYQNKCNICQQISVLSDAFVTAGLEIIKKRYNPTEELTDEEKKAKIKEIFNSIKKQEEKDNGSGFNEEALHSDGGSSTQTDT